MKKITLFFISIMILSNLSYGQKPRVKFERISVEEGLSQSTVQSMIQDSKGFIWLATVDGLNKYDGYNLKVYWNIPNQKNALTDNIVNALYETPNKDNPILWVGTLSNGLCRYNSEQDNFTAFKHDTNNKNSLSNNIISSICGNNETLYIGTYEGLNIFHQNQNKFEVLGVKEKMCSDTINILVSDKKGNIWVGTKKGLNHFNPKTKEIKTFQKKDGLIDNEINTLFVDLEGKLWIGTPTGVCVYNSNEKTFKNYTEIISKKTDINNLSITSIIQDRDSTFWLGTANEGLINYNNRTKETYLFTNNPALKNTISINSILCIYRDRSDILWVGTSLGGVNKWNRAADELTVFRHNPYDANSLSASQVRNIYTDKSNTVWIGTVEGGLNKWEQNKNKFIHYKHNPKNINSISNNHIRSILEDTNNNFWVATDGGGLNKFDRKTEKFKHYKHKRNDTTSISSNRAWKVLQDKTGRIWVATFGGGLNLFNPETEQFKTFKHNMNIKTTISNDLVTAIYEDKDGDLWIGTFGGLNKFYIKDKKFIRYQYNENDTNSLSNDRVYSLHEDKEGNLWVGTKGGLNIFNKEKGIFKRFLTTNSDLPNNVILGILEDGEDIWVSTNNGISRINKKTHKIKNFDVGDGLQSNEFLAGSYHKSKNGELFFGGIDGFNAFDPSKIKDNPNKPPIVITGFKISNQIAELDSSISVKKEIVLKYYQNDISFEFVALDFIFPEKNRYKYILVNNDEDWHSASYNRTATYTNLQPGEYTFKVIGSNNDDVWNEEGVSLKIIIKPAWWQTLWFKIAVVLFIIFSVVTFYQIRVRAIKRRNKELEAEVQRRTAEIRSQNEEIKAQRDEIASHRDEISKQKEEITDSIVYAKKIQTAALPADKFLDDIIPEYFILFKPRDIVSGDFYWAGKKGNKIIITAADCTGHGVPGAFMSMLGISFLNKIVNENNITDAGEILNQLRANIIKALHQGGSIHESKDGMDMSLSVIDLEEKTLQFAGAYNPLLYVKNGEIETIKADRMPVAIYDHIEPFSTTEVQFNKGDVIYMFSDGYPDQFGGLKGKKFMTKRMRNLLLENSQKPMDEQKKILDETIIKWIGTEEVQIDDIVVIGVRL